MSFADLARLCSEASAKAIAYINVSHDEKLAMFDAMGISRDYEDGMMTENTNAWASNEMITSEMVIKQQFFSLCSRLVKLITGRKALTMREVIALHIGGAVTT